MILCLTLILVMIKDTMFSKYLDNKKSMSPIPHMDTHLKLNKMKGKRFGVNN